MEIDSGNTAWMLTAAAMVLFMTPGLGFFYGGLTRNKNVLATIMQELAAANVDFVTLQQAGCVGFCEVEPMITITNKAGDLFRYGRLDKNKTREIVRGHILRGAVVNEYLIKD